MSSKFKGMTVNERLYVSNLLDAFDTAVKKKNVNKVIMLLKQVEIEDINSVNMILVDLGLIIS